MRVSVRKDDPGYKNFFGVILYEAYLDGKKVENVVTADEETGEVFFHARDEHGEFILNEAKDAIIEKRLTGKVEIRRTV